MYKREDSEGFINFMNNKCDAIKYLRNENSEFYNLVHRMLEVEAHRCSIHEADEEFRRLRNLAERQDDAQTDLDESDELDNVMEIDNITENREETKEYLLNIESIL